MIRYTITLTTLLAGISIASAVLPSDFNADTIGEAPAGWHIGTNPWTVKADPTNASNHVLDTSGRSTTVGDGNLVSGTGLTATLSTTGTLSFDFYLQNSTSADLSVSLTDVANLAIIGSSDLTYCGPTIRVVDSEIQIYDGGFVSANQTISTTTWYTIEMDVNNTTEAWSATILGGTYTEATAITISGSNSSFGYRNSLSANLVNFTIRPNNNNGTITGGALLDNISSTPIPEASNYASLLSLISLFVLWARFRRRN